MYHLSVSLCLSLVYLQNFMHEYDSGIYISSSKLISLFVYLSIYLFM